MATVVLIFLTAFAAVIYSAVAMIQIGGWLHILGAILLICHYFLSTSLIVILFAGAEAEKKKALKREATKL